MAIQVLAGIPWLAGVLGAAFTSILTFVLQFFTKKLAVITAVVLSLVGITVTFFAAITALFAGIQYVMPVAITQGMALIVPGNTTACLTAVVTGHTVRYVYAWQFRIIQYKLF